MNLKLKQITKLVCNPVAFLFLSIFIVNIYFVHIHFEVNRCKCIQNQNTFYLTHYTTNDRMLFNI